MIQSKSSSPGLLLAQTLRGVRPGQAMASSDVEIMSVAESSDHEDWD
jgi:hypothetical protein